MTPSEEFNLKEKLTSCDYEMCKGEKVYIHKNFVKEFIKKIKEILLEKFNEKENRFHCKVCETIVMKDIDKLSGGL